MTMHSYLCGLNPSNASSKSADKQSLEKSKNALSGLLGLACWRRIEGGLSDIEIIEAAPVFGAGAVFFFAERY